MSLLRKAWDISLRATDNPALPPFHPATVVCDWGETKLTLQDLRTGVCLTGMTGAGKSSILRHLALDLMRVGCGFVVACVKADEAAVWKEYARQAGRLDDVREVDASGRYRYNFLAEEAARPESEGGSTLNLTRVMKEVANALAGRSADDGTGNERFWPDAMSHLLMNLFDLMRLAGLPVTLRALRDLINSAPQSLDQAASDKWRESSACYRAIVAAASQAEASGDESSRVSVEEVASFFLNKWAPLDTRTRSPIELMLDMLIRPFLTPPLYRIFSTDTNLRPEDAADGRIIIVNLPVQIFDAAGVAANIIWKYATQRAVLRRFERHEGPYLRPLVVASDESQALISDFDYVYQAVARSGGGVTCYAFQDREALIGKLGNPHKIDALLSNLQCKIFAAATGPTAVWASELIGERYTDITDTNVGRHTDAVGAQTGVSLREDRRPWMDAHLFGRLRRGGPRHDFLVDAVLHLGGRPFEDGRPFKLLTFAQR